MYELMYEQDPIPSWSMVAWACLISTFVVPDVLIYGRMTRNVPSLSK